MNIPSHITPILSLIDPTQDWENMTINHWVFSLILINNLTIDYLPMELLDGSSTSMIISHFPEKINDPNIKLELINGAGWVIILQSHPHLVDYCDWKKLSSSHWDILQKYSPSLMIYRDSL